MNLPLPRRPPDRSRGGWSRDFPDPFGDLGQLWNRMGHLLEPIAGRGSWVPTVETEEEGAAYLVRAELPGMRRENIEVEIGSGQLRITGETKEEQEGGGDMLRRRRGHFAYRTTLPADADPNGAEARLAHGVLTVRLPKTGQTGARKIEITSEPQIA